MAHNTDSVNISDLWNDCVDNESDNQKNGRDEQQVRVDKEDPTPFFMKANIYSRWKTYDCNVITALQ